MLNPRPYLLLGLLSLGCGPQVDVPDANDSGDGGTTGTVDGGPGSQSGGKVTTGSMTTAMTTMTTSPPPATTVGMDTGDDDDDVSDSSGGGDDGGFLMPGDFSCLQDAPPGTIAHCSYCDRWSQDCPGREKCVPYDSSASGQYDALRCAPVDPNPVGDGEACTVQGDPLSGIDDCEFGSICWGVDPETNIGTCVAQCTGDEVDPLCGPPGDACLIANQGVVTVCLPGCDPLDAGTCSAGETCVPSDDTFVCAPHVGSKLPGGECFVNSCEFGSICAQGEVAGCPGFSCCTPLCDLTAPDCPFETQECTPYYDDGKAPIGLENLGLCVSE